MSSSDQEKRIDEAVKVVDWSDLASLSDEGVRDRWQNDPETSWPDASELAEFEIVISNPAKKSQAAE